MLKLSPFSLVRNIKGNYRQKKILTGRGSARYGVWEKTLNRSCVFAQTFDAKPSGQQIFRSGTYLIIGIFLPFFFNMPFSECFLDFRCNLLTKAKIWFTFKRVNSVFFRPLGRKKLFQSKPPQGKFYSRPKPTQGLFPSCPSRPKDFFPPAQADLRIISLTVKFPTKKELGRAWVGTLGRIIGFLSRQPPRPKVRPKKKTLVRLCNKRESEAEITGFLEKLLWDKHLAILRHVCHSGWRTSWK